MISNNVNFKIDSVYDENEHCVSQMNMQSNDICVNSSDVNRNSNQCADDAINDDVNIENNFDISYILKIF